MVVNFGRGLVCGTPCEHIHTSLFGNGFCEFQLRITNDFCDFLITTTFWQSNESLHLAVDREPCSFSNDGQRVFLCVLETDDSGLVCKKVLCPLHWDGATPPTKRTNNRFSQRHGSLDEQRSTSIDFVDGVGGQSGVKKLIMMGSNDH
ncbi:hypothetical protein OGAPHI_006783 [Ogataea philodendri]|uniref:Uncharacterized protein n=1 Tax=Ogataea philodendri TaxID=1378263 RepID=A0A9P8NY53_9ASCO|nr:uncharacterized protein OGAPHI_006783 [Ogataea philodendri]KAH3661376.1 hypothetical protein OGAPHI_006783 [Ogataea philodendri]